MTRSHTVRRVELFVILGILGLFSLGCAGPSWAVYQGVFGAPKRGPHKQQREKIEKLKKRLETKKKNHVARTKKLKAAIDAHIKKGLVKNTFRDIKALHKHFHPSYDRKTTHMVKDFKLADDAFVKKAQRRAYKLTSKMLDQGKFAYLDDALKFANGLPDKRMVARFNKQHKNLKISWVKYLGKQGKQVESKSPGAAMLQYTKAARLAKQIGRRDLQRQYAGMASKIREGLRAKYQYRFTFGSVSGPHADEIKRRVASRSWGSANIKLGGNAHVTLSINTSAPSFRNSRSTSQGSFTYTARMGSKPNPKIRELESKIRSADSDYRSAKSQIPTLKREKARNLEYYAKVPKLQKSSYKRGAENAQKRINEYQRKMSKAQSDKSRYQGQLSATPKTIKFPIKDRKNYTITTKTLRGSMSMTAKGVHSDRRGPVSAGSVSASASDTSHPAQRYKDGSVSADRDNPPTQGQVLGMLKSNAVSAVAGLVTKSMQQRRANVLKTRGDKNKRIHALVIYVLFDPSSVNKNAAGELVKLTGLNDAVSLAAGN